MSREKSEWDRLYKRAAAKLERPPAEVDSVPVPESWGTLPASEWKATEFLIPYLKGSSRWLDLGCGTGSGLAAFLTRFVHASGMGVDGSGVAISLGKAQLEARRELSGRMRLAVCDLGRPAFGSRHFDLVYALFSLQFLRLRDFYALATTIREDLLTNSGVFAGTVRSTRRSVPSSYVAEPGEPNTFVSYEPHELGMIYHHYSADEIRAAADILGGVLVYLEEKSSHRSYDPAPIRSWWDFVIRLP